MAKGERIKALREQFGFTQDELAEKLGTTKQTIYKYETGVITNIPSDKIEEMAALFGVTPSYLMGWDTQDQSSERQPDYYLNPEVAAKAQEIYEDSGTRILLDAKRDLSAEDLDVVLNMIKALKAKENHND